MENSSYVTLPTDLCNGKAVVLVLLIIYTGAEQTTFRR
jgi:hypothetical protein